MLGKAYGVDVVNFIAVVVVLASAGREVIECVDT